MNPLILVITLSDLLEAAGCEGEPIARLFDEEIFPGIRNLTEKADPIGLGDRFGRVIDKVRATINQTGKDRIRTLKDMMQSALREYVRKTNDKVTAVDIFHRAIMSGSDTMLTVTAATILANALAGMHPAESQQMVQRVAARLTGKQPRVPALENSSSAAVGAAAIATGGKKKKQRQDSIFAEDHVSWDDLLGKPTALTVLHEVCASGTVRRHDGVLVDPTTAELVLSVHRGLSHDNRRRYEAKSLAEMIGIAHRCVERGLIEVSMEEV